MSLHDLIKDSRVKRIITHPEDDTEIWRSDLERFISGDATLTRKSVGESGIRAVQRLMIFLGYSTSSSGSFTIDGDFGRGTNRGVAQFQVEFVARFLLPRADVVKKSNPRGEDFHKLARFYNGPKYAAHHYHESLARWFREFRVLMS